MAAITTPPTTDPSPPVVAVAYSAGRDSTALLHATASAAASQGLVVAALHVHHGLSPHADAWVVHARKQCEDWAERGLPVRLLVERLTTQPSRGDSVEAWARKARYRALRAMAVEAGAQIVLLAHHRRDQAETLLLQALRGGGVSGLASMAASVSRDGIEWRRPWLDKPREDIEAYIRAHGLLHIDDDSNDDGRYARNRLRLQVWPSLVTAFPQAESSLADAARWSAEAAACLDELAEIDLAAISDDEALHLISWQALSRARRVNALRAWLKSRTGQTPPATLVTRLVEELPGQGAAQWEGPGFVLRRYRQRLRCSGDAPLPRDASANEVPRAEFLSIRAAGRYALDGWGGELVAEPVHEGGVPVAWLAHLELRVRSGGEQFQAGTGRPPRSLKKQYQAAAQPSWTRAGPLVYSGGQLIFVPGLGIDARVRASAGVPQLELHWRSS